MKINKYRKSMRVWIAAFLMCLPVLANSTELSVKDHGVYSSEFNGKVVGNKQVPGGVIKPSSKMELLEFTDIVEAGIGIVFGFRFVPDLGISDSSEVALFCGEHPPMLDPKSKKTSIRECYQTTIEHDKLQWHTYVIEHDWEIVRGEWRLYIQNRNGVIAERVFKLE